MAGSSVAASGCDAEGGQGSVWVAGVAAQRGGDVDRPRPAQHPDDQVAQGRHDVRAAVGANLGGVLGEGDVADVVQRLDGPVPTDKIGEASGAGLLERQAGDRDLGQHDESSRLFRRGLSLSRLPGLSYR
jgi:hypothetical protein